MMRIDVLRCKVFFAAWQHPYVNVFKHLGLDKWTDVNKQGDVVPIIVSKMYMNNSDRSHRSC